MPLKTLRERVLEASLELRRRPVLYTFSKACGIDCREGWWPSSPAALLTRRYHTLSISAVNRPVAHELRNTDSLRQYGRKADDGQPKEAQ